MTVVLTVTPTQAMRLQEIGELTALSYLADQLVDRKHPYLKELRDAPARAADATLLVAVDGDDGRGQAVGTLTVVPFGTRFTEIAEQGEYELRMLAVSPLARGRGIGEQLTLAGVDIARAAGATRIVLSTMEAMQSAHRLYERLGFERAPGLDWVVYDMPDGTIEKRRPDDDREPPAGAGVSLLGYSLSLA